MREAMRDKGHSESSSVLLILRTHLVTSTNATKLSCVNGAWPCACCTVYRGTRTTHDHRAHIVALGPRRLFSDLGQRLSQTLRIRWRRGGSLGRALEKARRGRADGAAVEQKRVADMRDESLPRRGEREQMNGLGHHQKVV